MEFLEAMRSRFACKKYDVNRKLGEAQLKEILEYGRLTPTSFGLELWSFAVVESQEKKQLSRLLRTGIGLNQICYHCGACPHQAVCQPVWGIGP